MFDLCESKDLEELREATTEFLFDYKKEICIKDTPNGGKG
jgi:hypothetical protein